MSTQTKKEGKSDKNVNKSVANLVLFHLVIMSLHHKSNKKQYSSKQYLF